jgi:outer membrane immunogenic protein
MRKYLLLTSLSVFVVASPATAAGFVGPRVEIRGGWDNVSLNETLSDGVTSVSDKAGKDGQTFGGEIGYDAQVAPMITLGAYAEGSLPNTRECSEIFGDDEGCIKAPRNFAVGGRVGAIVGGVGLLYAKGGYSNGRLEVTYRDYTDILNSFSVHTDRGGWHVGAGAEVPILSHGYFKVEYVYTKYASYRFSDGTLTYKLGGNRNQAIAAVGFRF